MLVTRGNNVLITTVVMGPAFARTTAVVMCERATLSHVIARLDRATQYSGPPEIRTNGGDYLFHAFAGMTI